MIQAGVKYLFNCRATNSTRFFGGWLIIVMIGSMLMSGCALTGFRPAPTLQSKLEYAADSLLIPFESMGASVAISVKTIEGESVFSHDERRLMVPASIQKLAVAADALYSLPEDFHWETRIFGTGFMDSSGILHGDLAIVGSWDPSLSGDRAYTQEPLTHFRAWVEILVAQGLRQINGNLVIVGKTFTPGGWELGDISERYAPVISQLSWNDGLVVVPMGLGTHPLARTNPRQEFWTVDHLKSRLVNKAQEHKKAVSSQYPVADPRILAGDAFRQVLRKKGIKGANYTKVTTEIPFNITLGSLGLTHRSAQIDSVVKAMLGVSSNLWAEMVSATVEDYRGQDAKYNPGWQKTLSRMGVSGEVANNADACGMARRNNLSAYIITDLLIKANDKWGQRWVDLLPKPGQKYSTLETRLTDVSTNVRAKTGRMSRTRSLAGYILQDEKPDLVFCVIFNNCPEAPDNSIDEFIRALVRTNKYHYQLEAGYAVQR
ncbi:MAG: D-alanyl-D-alanine carboxypeptidase [Candidatus Electryonea clarkiae]|nr:D-alanyl-D-alanine carboxypeptidase [Candidatus Electryonea clarkiae]